MRSCIWVTEINLLQRVDRVKPTDRPSGLWTLGSKINDKMSTDIVWSTLINELKWFKSPEKTHCALDPSGEAGGLDCREEDV